jgi:membrane-associated protein
MIEWGGLPILFLLLMCEGNPVIGHFIPGQVMIVLIGFMIGSTGIFPFWVTLLVIFLSSFLGDFIGFYMGKKCTKKMIRRFGLDEESPVYKASNVFFEKFGWMSIILGRELNFTRAFIPFLAGVHGMKYRIFIVLGILSNAVFAILSLVLGYYFGGIVVDKLQFISSFGLFLLVYFLLIFMIFRSYKKLYHHNYIYFKKYAIKNIIFLAMFVGFIVTILLYKKYYVTNFFTILGDYLVQISSFLNFVFIYNLWIWIAAFILFLFAVIYQKKTHLFLIYVWGFIITLFATFTFNIIFQKWFDIKIYFTIVLISLLAFYFWIFIRSYFKRKKLRFLLEIMLVLILSVSYISFFSNRMDIYAFLISFFLAGFVSELIIILSHYEILDKKLYQSIQKNKNH